MTLKLGYKASAEQFDPRELVEIAVAAEAHGMESVAVSDHFQPWRHEGGHAPFSLAWMAAVGERTSSIRIGTSVMTPTFRYNPAVLAQAFASLGVMYPGRVFLGVGTGEALNEIATGFRGAGAQDWPEFRERFARLREAVQLMRALWTEDDQVSFEGEYYSTHGAAIYDRPETPVPVYVAAGGPVVARRVGRGPRPDRHPGLALRRDPATAELLPVGLATRPQNPASGFRRRGSVVDRVWSAQTLEHHRHALPATDAHRLDTEGLVVGLQVVQQGGGDAGTGHAERMTQGDGTTRDVELVVIDAEDIGRSENLHREGLVDLDEIDVGQRHAGHLEHLADGLDRTETHDLR